MKFDKKFYVEKYPDVVTSGLDPYEHYILYGKREGRLPCAQSTLDTISSAFRHWLKIFRKEGIIRPLRNCWTPFSSHGLKAVMGRITRPGKFSSQDIDYIKWIDHFDTPSGDRRRELESRISNFNSKPLISIVMPTYNSNIVWLKEAIASISNQVYRNWELCIADDASTDSRITQFLEGLPALDNRIKVRFCEENGHISRASNEALTLCTGEWVALIDHDDTLSEYALYHVVKTINDNPGIQLIYSDEDKIDVSGKRHEPYFKPDWNPDLFYSQNLFSHLGVYRRELLLGVGGFREGFEGSQDYDLVLRCVENISYQQIAHIPKILYHWRVHEESTASTADAKPYAKLAGERALNEHFARKHLSARAELVGLGYRVHYEVPVPHPLVSLIIPTRNQLKHLKTCISSIIDNTAYSAYEIIIVDNGSDDKSALRYLKKIQKLDQITVVRDDKPFNYSALNNLGVSFANGTIIGLLNNDTEVINPEWLGEMVSHCSRDDVGAVGARLWYPNDTLQHGGIVLGLGADRVAGHVHRNVERGSLGYFSRLSLCSNYSAVTAACLLVKKELYLEVGGFDAMNLPVAYNDVDFCLKLSELGYRNVFTPYADLYRHESVTRGKKEAGHGIIRNNGEIAYMQARWGPILLQDPMYNPNLTIDDSDFGLAWPPRDTG